MSKLTSEIITDPTRNFSGKKYPPLPMTEVYPSVVGLWKLYGMFWTAIDKNSWHTPEHKRCVGKFCTIWFFASLLGIPSGITSPLYRVLNALHSIRHSLSMQSANGYLQYTLYICSYANRHRVWSLSAALTCTDVQRMK